MTTRTTRPYFLNEAVKAVVLGDFKLLAMWVATRSTYDDDIEPLHNPSWVANARSQEQAHLEHLQEKVALARTVYAAKLAHDAKDI